MSLVQLQQAFAARERHFAPFFMLGDPDPDTCLALVETAVAAGASMIELGLPFSDPVADGPAIQLAALRAAKAGVNVNAALKLMAKIRERVEVPLNLLVYGNLVHARGSLGFTQALADHGAASLLVPDIGFQDSAPLSAACERAGIGLVHFLGPHTAPARALEMANQASAFLYLAGHQGVTGAQAQHSNEAIKEVAAASPIPVAVGFGLRTAQHVEHAFEGGARIAVVGSQLARLIEHHTQRNSPRAELIHDLQCSVRRLALPTHGDTPCLS